VNRVLSEDVVRIAAAGSRFAAPGEQLVGVLPAQPFAGPRVYLCAFESADGRTWLALDEAAEPIADRGLVREASSIAALCEIAEETAGGGHLEQLRQRLTELRETEAPAGIEEAEEAASELARTLEPDPRLARTEYLDAIGAASRRLERALGEESGSPFAAAMQQATAAVEELVSAVEQHHKTPLA
jgi:hypothetical protein